MAHGARDRVSIEGLLVLAAVQAVKITGSRSEPT